MRRASLVLKYRVSCRRDLPSCPVHAAGLSGSEPDPHLQTTPHLPNPSNTSHLPAHRHRLAAANSPAPQRHLDRACSSQAPSIDLSPLRHALPRSSLPPPSRRFLPRLPPHRASVALRYPSTYSVTTSDPKRFSFLDSLDERRIGTAQNPHCCSRLCLDGSFHLRKTFCAVRDGSWVSPCRTRRSATPSPTIVPPLYSS